MRRERVVRICAQNYFFLVERRASEIVLRIMLSSLSSLACFPKHKAQSQRGPHRTPTPARPRQDHSSLHGSNSGCADMTLRANDEFGKNLQTFSSPASDSPHVTLKSLMPISAASSAGARPDASLAKSVPEEERANLLHVGPSDMDTVKEIRLLCTRILEAQATEEDLLRKVHHAILVQSSPSGNETLRSSSPSSMVSIGSPLPAREQYSSKRMGKYEGSAERSQSTGGLSTERSSSSSQCRTINSEEKQDHRPMMNAQEKRLDDSRTALSADRIGRCRFEEQQVVTIIPPRVASEASGVITHHQDETCIHDIPPRLVDAKAVWCRHDKPPHFSDATTVLMLQRDVEQLRTELKASRRREQDLERRIRQGSQSSPSTKILAGGDDKRGNTRVMNLHAQQEHPTPDRQSCSHQSFVGAQLQSSVGKNRQLDQSNVLLHDSTQKLLRDAELALRMGDEKEEEIERHRRQRTSSYSTASTFLASSGASSLRGGGSAGWCQPAAVLLMLDETSILSASTDCPLHRDEEQEYSHEEEVPKL